MVAKIYPDQTGVRWMLSLFDHPKSSWRIAMNKFAALAATFALLCNGSAVAIAANGGTTVTCKDGTKRHASKDACSDHGGVKKSKNTSTPIDTTKGLTPPSSSTTTTKNKTNASSVSKTTRKKTTSKATRNPTARCNDGAQYFSTERRGACASHGGVKTWY